MEDRDDKKVVPFEAPKKATGNVPHLVWVGEVERDVKTGAIIDNIPNAEIVLRMDPRWKGTFGYNEFERRVFVRREMPWDERGSALEEPRPVNNHDHHHVQAWLQKQGYMQKISAETVYAAIQIVAHKAKYHPIKDWLRDLPAWDKTPRVDCWLQTIFGVDHDAKEPSLYATMVGRMFLLGMYRRIMTPGIKMDYMLILEGDQGLRKSSACQTLCGGMGYGVGIPKELSSVDTSIFLRNKWLIEMGELHALRKADINELKQWLVKEVEDYRPKYGRTNEHEPRQCVFVGTSNNSEYLNDPTGGRRFWPVHCTKSDIEQLITIREQLWAEVKLMDEAGELHYPDPEIERLYFVPQQKARMVVDPWEAEINGWIARMDKVSNTYLYTRLGITTIKIDHLVTNRIKNIMKKLGWEQGRSNKGVVYLNPNKDLAKPKPKTETPDAPHALDRPASEK